MTEVPEHLLRRAKERRAAMTGEPAGDAGAAESSTAVEAAGGATPATATGSGGGGAPAVPAAPAPPPYTGPPPAKPRKQRVPIWAGAALLAMPLWAVLYGGAFGARQTGELTIAQQGAVVFRSAGCAGCHGPTGGGGVGPALNNVTKTFPNFADHISWVHTGSKPFQGQTYGSGSRVATGGMPAFKDSLSDAQILAVVCHERIDFGKEATPKECEEGAGTDSATAKP